MAKDRLIIVDRNYVFRVVWFLGDEQEEGATLGDCNWEKRLSDDPTDEHALASKTASEYFPTMGDHGFYWGTRSGAEAARRAANAAIKVAQSEVPWPEWAQQALKAGWKTPKGWKPGHKSKGASDEL